MRDASVVRYLRALRRRLPLIVGLCIVAVIGATVATILSTKRYQATAAIQIKPLSPSDSTYVGFNSVFQQAPDASLPVVTAAAFFNSEAVKLPCLRALPAKARPASISLAPLGQADVIQVTAQASSAAGAAAAANGFTRCALANRDAAFQAELHNRLTTLKNRIAAIPANQRDSNNFVYQALAQQLATYSTSVGLPNPTTGLLSVAAVPTSPVWPRPKLALAASLIVALLLGIGIALLLEAVSPRITSEETLRTTQRLPILARIPRLRHSDAQAYLAGTNPLPNQAWKGYRLLRAVLARAGADGGYPKSIVVTSAIPGEAKTTTAINLALAIAQADQRVVLVDADVHRPMLATFFNVPAHRNGFKRFVDADRRIRSSLVPAPLDPNLQLILASPYSGGYEGLTESGVKKVFEYLAENADVVIVDCPPLTEVAEIVEIASAAEVVILSARLGRTRLDKLEHARELLSQRGVSPMGFVLTTSEGESAESHYDYPSVPLKSAATLQPPPPSQLPIKRAAGDSPPHGSVY